MRNVIPAVPPAPQSFLSLSPFCLPNAWYAYDNNCRQSFLSFHSLWRSMILLLIIDEKVVFPHTKVDLTRFRSIFVNDQQQNHRAPETMKWQKKIGGSYHKHTKHSIDRRDRRH